MSFRTSYNDYKSRSYSGNKSYYRDPTPKEWERTMDEYYKQQQKKK